MKRTLYLHIGVHRTATTSTQKYLRLNFKRLMKHGYFLPYGAGRHFELFNRIFDKRVSVEEAAADLTKRADNRDDAEVRAIILSDEDVCMRRNLSRLARFQDTFDVKVVFAMRRQDLWIESWYQQNTKWQWNTGLSHLAFPEFSDRWRDFFWVDYDAMMTKLTSKFGAENVIALPFERGQMPDGPVAAFCDAIGLTDRTDFKDPPHTNTSPSALMTEFMRTLPLDEMPGPVRSVFEQSCAQVDRQLDLGDQSTLFFEHEARAELMAQFDPGNRAVAERYFDRAELFHDPLPPSDAPLAIQSLPEDTYETQELLVAPMMRALALRIAKLSPPRDTSIAGTRRRPAKAKAPRKV